MKKNNKNDTTMSEENVMKKRGPVQWAMTILGICIIGWGLYEGVMLFVDHVRYETSDDAQVEQYVSPINAKVQGCIKDIRFSEHQFVHKGDTLVIIDDAEYLLKLQQADAMIDQAEAGIGVQAATMNTINERVGTAAAGEDIAQAGTDAALASIGSAQAHVEETRAAMENALSECQRYENLLAKDAATPQQYERMKTALETATSRYNSAKASLEAAKSRADASKAQYSQSSSNTRATAAGRKEQSQRILQTQANSRAAKAQRALAALNLSYTVITAPCDGWVGRRSIQVGQLIMPGITITSIIPNTPKWVIANFRETQTEHIAVGQEVTITIDAISKREYKGRVTSKAGATGAKFSAVPTDNSAGNFVKIQQRIPVRIDFEGLSQQDYDQMAAGMMAVARVKL